MKNRDVLSEFQFIARVTSLEERIKEKIAGMSVTDLKEYFDSDTGSMDVLHWMLMKEVAKKGEILDIASSTPGIQWLLSNREAMEILLASIVGKDKIPKHLANFDKLFKEDPLIPSNPLHLRLAIATAISSPTKSRAVHRNMINWQERYWNLLRLAEEGVLLPQFFRATAWHLKEVVNSGFTDEDLAWGRAQTSEKKIAAGKVGDMGGYFPGSGISYRKRNAEGCSVQSRKQYYYWLPTTLQLLSAIGGVCGALSSYNMAMAQAFGVPARCVAQPGHCAYIFWNGETWKLRNNVGGWAVMKHSYYNPGYIINVFEEAMSNRFSEFILSEKMRFAAPLMVNTDARFKILDTSTSVCAFNYYSWIELINTIRNMGGISKLDQPLQDILKDILLKDKPCCEETQRLLSSNMVILTAPDMKNRHMLNNERKHGKVQSDPEGRMTVELELEGPCHIDQLQLDWSPTSAGKYSYRIYAKNPNEEYRLVRTSLEEFKEGVTCKWEKGLCGAVIGWDLPTQNIKIETDCNGDRNGSCTIELSDIFITGTRTTIRSEVLRDKEITVANSGNPQTSQLSNNTFNLEISDSEDGTGWFEIDVGKMAVLRELELKWGDGTKPKSVRVIMKGGSNDEEVLSEDSVEQVRLYQTSLLITVQFKI